MTTANVTLSPAVLEVFDPMRFPRGSVLREKLCKDCSTVKPSIMFSKDKSKSTGLATYCKDCQKVRKHKHYWANPSQSRASSNNWYRSNKDMALDSCRKWREENRDRRLARRRVRFSERMASDINFRLEYVMRASMYRLTLPGRDSVKLGYTSDQLKQRMECQFTAGMSWDNYGEWEIDHRIPVSLFMRRGEARPNIISALSNLKPLWKAENRSKGNSYVG